MSDRQARSRQMFREAAVRLVQAEYEEALSVAKLAAIPERSTAAEIQERIAENTYAHVCRITAEIHLANCRTEMRLAWEEAQRSAVLQ